MAKYTLWNDDIKIEDWKECIEEEIMNERYPDYEGDVDTFIDEYSDECYEYICELNCIYLDDERANLSIRTAGEIICIADLGLWNGRRMGYKLIGHNIADCLYSSVSGDSRCDWYVETNGRACDLKCTEAHHDGTNYYVYREIKPEISEYQKNAFLNKIYCGKATQADISRCTKGIGHYVNDVYGFIQIKKGA